MTHPSNSELRGDYYDGQSAAAHPICLSLDDNGNLHLTPALREKTPLTAVVVSSQIGSTPRTITFADGALIETHDHAIINAWLAAVRPRTGWVHRLETHSGAVFGALLLLAGFVTASVIWGIPWASQEIANRLPAEITQNIGSTALESMDKLVLQPSKLSDARRTQLAQLFQTLITDQAADITYRLEFRRGGVIGANAFAFPHGTIVMTDELVKLAEVDEELASILLHEIGHLDHRHSLRQIISHSSLAILTTLLTGDVSAAGTAVLAAPNVMLESRYSRQLETEADSYALKEMPRLGMATEHFANIMERLEQAIMASAIDCNGMVEQSDAEDGCEESPNSDDTETADETRWLGYFTSHPLTKERITRFRGDSQPKN